jgi:hypothetical protein
VASEREESLFAQFNEPENLELKNEENEHSDGKQVIFFGNDCH